MIFLDTHVVMWLHIRDMGRLGGAQPHISGRALLISPMVELELQLLHEIGRLKTLPAVVIGHLAADVGLAISQHPFDDVVHHAAKLSWTRDPFDRLIVAQAIAGGAPLCTADDRIRRHFAGAVWGASPQTA